MANLTGLRPEQPDLKVRRRDDGGGRHKRKNSRHKYKSKGIGEKKREKEGRPGKQAERARGKSKRRSH